MEQTRLGTILLENRLVDESVLEKCIEIQTLTGGSRPLGQILVEQGAIAESMLESLLAMQQQRTAEQWERLPASPDEDYVATAVAAGANELVVSEGRPVLARIANCWRTMTEEPVRGPEVWDFVRQQMGHDVLEELAERKFVARDYRRAGVCRGRITAFRHFDGVSAILRLHPASSRTATELGVTDSMEEALAAGKGLILICGDRASGRTELMGWFLRAYARDGSRFGILVDDTLEHDVPTDGALIVQRRIGEHVTDYVTAMRTALREDVDGLFVGDIGSAAAFDMALRAAEGGRLVVAGMHANSVVGAMLRALNFYPSLDIPRVRTTLAAVIRSIVVTHLMADAKRTGMVMASELLLATSATREVIRCGEIQNLNLLMRVEDGSNGHSLDRSLLGLLATGNVRFEDVFVRAEEKAWVLERSRQSGHKVQ